MLGVIFPPLLVVGLVVAVGGIWKMAHFPEVDLHPHWLTFLNDRKLGMWVVPGVGGDVLLGSDRRVHRLQDSGRLRGSPRVLNLPLATSRHDPF